MFILLFLFVGTICGYLSLIFLEWRNTKKSREENHTRRLNRRRILHRGGAEETRIELKSRVIREYRQPKLRLDNEWSVGREANEDDNKKDDEDDDEWVRIDLHQPNPQKILEFPRSSTLLSTAVGMKFNVEDDEIDEIEDGKYKNGG
ncbi:MAG: hypothetical protein GF349_04830 [Candidatus Magasanikbacteria bacterium]|nr:hypothetical protein [Candidatus Magasanikbacteria bacterium]